MTQGMRTLLMVVGALVAALILALGGMFLTSEARMTRTYPLPSINLHVPSDQAAVANGKRLVSIRGCKDCHGDDLGGKVLVDSPAVGSIFSSNLTHGQGGLPDDFSDEAYVLAIRYGLTSNGRPLIGMPSDEFNGLADDDLGAIIAYLKTIPPVDRAPSSPRKISILVRVFYLFGQAPLVAAEKIDFSKPPLTHINKAETVEYGAYLAQGCTTCHGKNLAGGPIPGAPSDTPIPANLTPDKQSGLGSWSKEDFTRALREGQRPDGSSIDPFMPWKTFSQLDDTELGALWIYLKSVPPVALTPAP